MASEPSNMVPAPPLFRFRGGKVVQIAVLVIVCAIIVFPMYWMVLSTVQPYNYSLIYSPSLFLKGIELSPFHDIFANHPMGQWLWNSTQVALMVTAICLGLSLFGAYALSKLRWKAKPAFGFFILLTQMMPGAIMTEGCGEMGVLWRMMLPLSLPGLVAVCVVAFFFSWNEYLFASTFISTDSGLLPGAVGLTTLIGLYSTPTQTLLAAGLIFSLPPVVFYILIQRYMISGLTAGAVKG